VTSTPPDAPPGESEDAERPLVLIVDDNEKNLKLARDVLRAGGFRTLEAATGAVAIVLATEYLPDVILMDLRLPDIDGADAARNLGERARTARIPIVGLSSVPLGESDWFLAAGFAGYLEKPISVAEFAGQVRRYCRRHRW
jgi:two-component system, cell cycle response regulator DivK